MKTTNRILIITGCIFLLVTLALIIIVPVFLFTKSKIPLKKKIKIEYLDKEMFYLNDSEIPDSLENYISKKIPVKRKDYYINLENIEIIHEIKFYKNSTLLIEDEDSVSISIDNETINIHEINGDKNISKIIFPEDFNYILDNKKVNLKFKSSDYFLKIKKNKDWAKKEKNSIHIESDSNIVRINEKGIFVNSDDNEYVELGNRGLIVKSDDENIRIGGVFGRILGGFTKSIVNIVMEEIYHSHLSLLAIINEAIDPKEDFDLDINFNNCDLDIQGKSYDLKQTDIVRNKTEKFVYEDINGLKIYLKRSDLSLKKSSDKNVHLTIIKNYIYKNGYSLKIETSDRILYITEKIKSKTKKHDAKFILHIPDNMVITTENISGDSFIEQINIKRAKIHSISGDINNNNFTINDNMTINTISGDIIINSHRIPVLNLKTISGDIKLENIELSNLKINTVSGDTSLLNIKVDNLKYSSVSGDLLGNNCSIKQQKLNSTSGEIEFTNVPLL